MAWTKHRTSPRLPPRWSNIGLVICLRAHVLTATLISGLFGQWHFDCMCNLMIWNGQGYRRNPFLMVLNRYTFPGLRACFICGYHAAVGELYCALKRKRAVLHTTSKLRCDTLCADSNIGWLWNIFHAFFLFYRGLHKPQKNIFATKFFRSTVAMMCNVQSWKVVSIYIICIQENKKH